MSLAAAVLAYVLQHKWQGFAHMQAMQDLMAEWCWVCGGLPWAHLGTSRQSRACNTMGSMP